MAWKGAALGAGAAALLITLVTVHNWYLGLGWAFELLIGLLLVAAALALSGLLCWLLFGLGWALWKLLRRDGPCWRPEAARAGLAVGLLVGAIAEGIGMLAGWGGVPLEYAWPVYVAALLLPAAAGLAGGAAGRHRFRRALPVAIFVLALAINGAGIGLLLYRQGYAATPAGEWAPPPGVAPLRAPSPADAGPYPVNTLTYGSGTNRHRPEYGAEVTIRTDPVDLSSLATLPAGLRRRGYDWSFGVDLKEAPVNGRVWYPEGEGPFPLVLIVHGSHQATHYSDPGYAYLASLLASRGYIAASIDQNFLNGSWYGAVTSEMPARAYLLLRHIAAWRAFAATEGGPFYGQVDLNRIALVGHSRGGEAAAVAADLSRKASLPRATMKPLDFAYQIRSVVALAPCDGFYRASPGGTELADINYMVIQGGRDTDVGAFMGLRQYDRTVFTGDGERYKAALWIDHMNHGQMNAVWNRDRLLPAGFWFQDYPVMKDEEARQAVAAFVSAFLDLTVQGDNTYLPLLQNPAAGAAWLPGTAYAALYADWTFQPIADYEEDAALQSIRGGAKAITFRDVTVQERMVALHTGATDPSRPNTMSRGAYIAWEAPGAYEIALPDGLAVDVGSQLTFTLGSNVATPVDLSIELTDAEGHTARQPLSRWGAPVERPTRTASRFGYLDRRIPGAGVLGPVLRTYQLPLADFPEVDPTRLERIRLVFDRVPAGEIVLDDVGIRSAP